MSQAANSASTLVSAMAARRAAGTIKDKAQTALARLQAQRDRAAAKVAERDEKMAETRRRAEDDRRDVEAVGDELGTIYGDPDELLKHARVVGIDEIEENEFNLNIPRYVDTFEAETRVEVRDALTALRDAERAAVVADKRFGDLLRAAYEERGSLELPSGWARLPMDALIVGEPKNGVSPKTSSKPPGIPTFSIAAIRNGRVDLTNASNLKYSQIPPRSRRNTGLRRATS